MLTWAKDIGAGLDAHALLPQALQDLSEHLIAINIFIAENIDAWRLAPPNLGLNWRHLQNVRCSMLSGRTPVGLLRQLNEVYGTMMQPGAAALSVETLKAGLLPLVGLIVEYLERVVLAATKRRLVLLWKPEQK